MTHLVLVRHGESIWHKENRYAGSSDIGLTAQGYKDAELLARWARNARLDALWISPLSRTRATADPVAEVTGLAPRVDDRLRELYFGKGEGKTAEEMRQLFPEAYRAFQADPVANHLPGGENPHKAVERVIAAFREIQQLYPHGKVLVVTHSTLLRLALCQLLEIPLRKYRSVFPTVRNCTLTELLLDGEKASLLSFNTPIETPITSLLEA